MTGFEIVLTRARGLRNSEKVIAAVLANTETLACVGALPVANTAKILVRKKTGTLMRSIHIGGHADLTPDTKIGGDLFDYGDITPPQTDENGAVTVFVGTNLDYARIIEFGGFGRISAAAKAALAKYGGGQAGGNVRPAYPYLRPAFNDPATQDRSRADVEAAANTLIQQAVSS